MDDYSTRYSAHASLAAVGLYARQRKIWQTIGQHVHINQKVITHTPLDKLKDAFLNILAGGHGVVEINSRVRPDEALQRAFDRESCADQSTVSDTLNACTEVNVEQMRQAVQEVYRAHSRGYRHKYHKHLQVLDVDMTGMPAGRQGEGVTKGFFAGKRNRRGRQLGRVSATLYDEIVVDRLYPGKIQLERSLQELVTAAERVLVLDRVRRQRTIIRCDGGGGRDTDINWLLQNDYLIMTKVKNWKRAHKLAQSVRGWYLDPKTEDREVGWVEEQHAYIGPTRQLALRMRKKGGGWHYRILVFNLSDAQLFWLARQSLPPSPTSMQIMLAALYAYDLRGGGVETCIKGSKHGLGLTKRNKKRFTAQEMLVLLAQLAFNLIIWVRNLLAHHTPKLQGFGMLRMVRDVFHIMGRIRLDAQNRIREITLNQTHPHALPVVLAMSFLLAQDDMALNLGQI
jgi:hypothetical protein